MKKILICLGTTLMLLMTGCIASDDNENVADSSSKTEAVKDTQLNLYIDYEANIFMAKEPADIYIDGEKSFSVLNGEESYNSVMLSKGNHEIKVNCGGNTETEEIYLESSDQLYQFHIKNHTSEVEFSFLGCVEIPTNYWHTQNSDV